MQENVNQQYGDRFVGIDDDDDDDDEAAQDSAPKEDDDFDMDEYTEENHLKSLEDIRANAVGHHLRVRNMPIKVSLQIMNTGSHFSEEKFNLAIVHVVLTAVFVAMAILNY